MDVIASGRTLLFRETPQAKPHLWLVLTDPAGDPPEILAVMVTTLRSHSDETVVLDVDDHEFIRHPTSVRYSTAQRFRVSQISAALRDGRCHLRADMSEALLARVRAGLLQSPYTVRAIARYAGEQFPEAD